MDCMPQGSTEMKKGTKAFNISYNTELTDENIRETRKGDAPRDEVCCSRKSDGTTASLAKFCICEISSTVVLVMGKVFYSERCSVCNELKWTMCTPR